MTTSPPKTSLKQKFGLIFLGLCISLVALEISLRLIGATFLWMQERKNQAGTSSQEAFTVLCLGESTTALGGDHSYPRQLEEILNERDSSREYRVINKGVPSITSEYIYEQLPNQLKTYQPDVVVTMMGINDHITKKELNRSVSERLLDSLSGFRVVKFIGMVIPYVRGRVEQQKEESQMDTGFVSAEESESGQAREQLMKSVAEVAKASASVSRMIDQSKMTGKNQAEQDVLKKFKTLALTEMKLNIAIGQWYRVRGELAQAELYYLKAIEADPKNPLPYIMLGRCFRHQGKYQPALKMYQQAGLLNSKMPKNYLEMARLYRNIKQIAESVKIYNFIVENKIGDHWMYLEAADYLARQNLFSSAERAYRMAIEKDPRSSNAYYRLGQMYLKQNKHDLARKSFEDALIYSAHQSRVYAGMADVFKAQNQSDQAEIYAKKSAEVEERFVHPYTHHYYDLIADVVLKSDVKMVSMQYPMLSQTAWTNSLKQADQITFVENKENFETALDRLEYSEYFNDHFAGDFGHCTPKCNRLLADNLATTIIRLANSDG